MKGALLERPENSESEELTREQLLDKYEASEMENGRLRADLALVQKTLKIAEILANHNEKRAALAEKDAVTDKLTGIKNRRGLAETLEERRPELQGNVFVMLVDADKFKPINDDLGHDAGDVVLQKIAEHLQGLVRSGDEVARMGGDEFAVIFFGGEEEALMEKFGKGLSFEMEYNGKPLSINLSTGIVAKLPDEKIEDTVKRADEVARQFKRERGVER
jgi:diguanylate cyclase (GGDEF)-like protein